MAHEAPPDGTYVGRVISIEQKVSGQKESEFLELRCQITEGDYAGQQYEAALWFSQEAWQRSMETLLICGWDGDDLVNFTGVLDNEVDLVIQTEEPQPRTEEGRRDEFYPAKTRVNFINARGSSVLGRLMNAQEKGTFMQGMMAMKVKMGIEKRERGAVINSKAGAPTTTAKPTAIPVATPSSAAPVGKPNFSPQTTTGSSQNADGSAAGSSQTIF